MSEERCARVRSAMIGRVLKSLLLALALVCATAETPAGRAGSLRRNVDAPPQFWDSGGGGLIAFEAGGEIYVVGAGGGTPTKVVESKAEVTNTQPALSPDGSRIAFSSNRDGVFNIYVVGIDGEGLRRITNSDENDSEPAWSPDGSRIAFARGFDATGNGVYVQSCIDWSDIIVTDVDAESHKEVNLTNGTHGTDPAWSPDGKLIAFASDRTGNFEIYTMSSDDGGDVHRLTENDWADADPAWSPDGSQIAYTTALRIAGGTQCGYMPISGGPTGGGPGGGTFAGGGGPYIYKMDADGKSQKPLTDEGGAAQPSWSPDGSRIVFNGAHKDSVDVQLYLIPSTSDSVRWTQLTFDASQKSSPSWSHEPGR